MLHVKTPSNMKLDPKRGSTKRTLLLLIVAAILGKFSFDWSKTVDKDGGVVVMKALVKDGGAQRLALDNDEMGQQVPLEEDVGARQVTLGGEGVAQQVALEKNGRAQSGLLEKDGGAQQVDLQKDGGAKQIIQEKDGGTQRVALEKDGGTLPEALEFAKRDLETSAPSVQEFKPDWKKVIGEVNHTVFIYSAFLDHRMAGSPIIRVLVLVPTKQQIFVECSFWTIANATTTVDGLLTISPYLNWQSVASGQVACHIPDILQTATNETKIPSQGMTVNSDPVVRVAISTKKGMSQNYSASIPVEDLTTKRRKQGELNVCVKQMHSGFNRAIQLVEFIELHRILGADHFTFYNQSIGPDVERVLQHYIKEGVADVLPCSSPFPTTYGFLEPVQISLHTDCVFRSVGRFPLAAITDVDEIVVPRKVDDDLKMVQELGHFAEYRFQNAFFFLVFEEENDKGNITRIGRNGEKINFLAQMRAVHTTLFTQRKTRRLAVPHPHTERAKYFCRPETVLIATVHEIEKSLGHGNVLLVDKEIALSHHYRVECVEEDPDCSRKATTVDRTAQRFREPLTKAVIQVRQAIFSDP